MVAAALRARNTEVTRVFTSQYRDDEGHTAPSTTAERALRPSTTEIAAEDLRESAADDSRPHAQAAARLELRRRGM